MFQSLNSQTFYSIATSIAKKVGDYQRAQLHEGFRIEYKSSVNLVTEVDKKSEAMIVQAIRDQFPHHDIMAEEGGADRKDSPYKWIIDPLDGTTNYAHGYPFFATSIALENQGQVIGGVVYDPMRDELFQAFQGEGAFLNRQPIRVSEINKLEKALMATGFAYNHREAKENNYDHFIHMMHKAQAVRRDGTAALDMCYVACGRYDGFWELNLFPWDTAAGLIIALEAGAKVSRFNGKSYTIYEKDILLSNDKIHKELLAVLCQKGHDISYEEAV